MASWVVKIGWRWPLSFIILSACVEPITFDIPPADILTMVEGLISDRPGPYTVKISTALPLDADTVIRPPVTNAKIKLYDDEGNVENFIEINPGEYITGGVIQGEVGHAYHIKIETSDGSVFESEPDTINPVGEIEEIRYEYEARTVEMTYGEIPANVFKIYVDANAPDGNDNYMRWRFNGTYKVQTNPELHMIFSQVSAYRDPLPCSGYILLPASGGGKLEQVTDCTCCTCWAKHYESIPQLSDVQLVSDNKFRDIKVGEVPIDQATFYEKYKVDVEQMSMSRTSYEFFKLVRSQKEGASSIFQPPSGEIVGNVHSVDSKSKVIGIFWAASINSKSIYIDRSEVPYTLPPIYFVPFACTYYPSSSTVKPLDWN